MTEIVNENPASAPHRNCSQLVVDGLPDGTVHRFILQIDPAPQQLGGAEIADLGDKFALRLLAAGTFPGTAGEVLQELAALDPAGPLAQQDFFLVGEGSQIPAGIVAQRNLRFLVTCGREALGPDVVLSSFHPDQGMVEVMAWDDLRGGFNFYRTMPDTTAWVFAGNSRHALAGPSRNHGPFESHRNGHFLFKEFKSPWVHWHSPFATIRPSVLAAQGLENHPWVSKLEPGGAYSLEERAAKPLIRRWTKTRVERILSGQSEETPGRMLEQLVDTLTVNLVSSFTRGADAVRPDAQVDLPGTFFVDADLLEQVELARPPVLAVAGALYAGALTANGVHLVDGGSFRQAGDTHFAFVVPERAHEDVVTIRQALEARLLTRRLVACLLMVDFPNPVFSRRRKSLLTHISNVAFDGSGETYSTAVGDAIATSPNASNGDGSPEAEFAGWWKLGDDFASAMDQALSDYYTALQAALVRQDGVTAVHRLADSRREHVKAMPIAESALLFSTPTTATMPLRMTGQAEVAPDQGDEP